MKRYSAIVTKAKEANLASIGAGGVFATVRGERALVTIGERAEGGRRLEAESREGVGEDFKADGSNEASAAEQAILDTLDWEEA